MKVLFCALLYLCFNIAVGQPLSDGFDYPVGKPNGDGYYNAQDFGEANHCGEDWNGNGGGNSDLNDPVYSVSNGTVTYSANAGSGWGNVIIVQHRLPDGSQVNSLYGHLSERLVSAGADVTRGQHIGKIGTGDGEYIAHLHFEMRDGTYRNTSPGPGYASNRSGWLNPTNKNEGSGGYIDAHRSLGTPSSIRWTHSIPWANWYRNNIELHYHADGSDPMTCVELIDGQEIARYTTHDGYVNGAARGLGWHIYEAAAINPFGGYSYTGQFHSGFDDQAPWAALVGDTLPNVWYNGPRTVVFRSDDAQAGPRRARYRWNNGPWSEWIENPQGRDGNQHRPLFDTGIDLPEGENSLVVEVEDDTWVNSDHDGINIEAGLGLFRRDTQLPSVPSVSFNPTSPSAAEVITVSASANDPQPGSGVAKIEIWIGDTKVHEINGSSGNYEWHPGEGNFNVRVRAVDAAGNVGGWNEQTYQVIRAKLLYVAANPTTVVGGFSTTGIVKLDRVAPAGGITVALQSGSAAITVPATVTVPSGAQAVSFVVKTGQVASESLRSFGASLNGSNKTVQLRLLPIGLQSFVLNPTSVVGGLTTKGTVTLPVRAPAGGVKVQIIENSTSISCPTLVTVSEGAYSTSFQIQTSYVATTSVRSISAKVGAVTRTANLTIQAGHFLLSFTVSPSTLTGGNNATGVVRLNGPAPAGGLNVQITTASTAITVPATVKVAAGSSVAFFTIRTAVVTETAVRKVKATFGAKSIEVAMTLLPQG